MAHPICPILVGSEGISKKVSVPFFEPLKVNQALGVELRCTLPRCVKSGFGYYTSTSSFGQSRVQRYTVQLIFIGALPQWLRVYESKAGRPSTLLKTLRPSHVEPYRHEYIDEIYDRNGQSARVYAFWRDKL